MPYQQPSGKWRAVITITGQRYQRTFDTKSEAKRWEVEEKAKLKSMAQTPQSMALNIFFSKYLDFSEINYTEKVFKEKKALCQKLVKLWGKETPVEAVTVDMVASYLEQQVKSRSANSANKDRKNLLAMWTWGQKRYDFPTNPVAKVDKYRHERKPQHVPTTEDVQRLLMAATGEGRALLIAYLSTAARRNEVFKWKWADDINFERREVRLGSRKNRDGVLQYVWMPMNSELYDSLKWLWGSRKYPDSPFVFVSDSHRYRGQPFVTRPKFMKELCKKAGIQYFGYHGLRRYCASVLADTHKLSSKRIQRILRHASVRTTEKYMYNLNDDMRSDLELLSSENTPQTTPESSKGLTVSG